MFIITWFTYFTYIITYQNLQLKIKAGTKLDEYNWVPRQGAQGAGSVAHLYTYKHHTLQGTC